MLLCLALPTCATGAVLPGPRLRRPSRVRPTQRSRIVPPVRQRKAAGAAQHVRVRLEAQVRRLAGTPGRIFVLVLGCSKCVLAFRRPVHGTGASWDRFRSDTNSVGGKREHSDAGRGGDLYDGPSRHLRHWSCSGACYPASSWSDEVAPGGRTRERYRFCADFLVVSSATSSALLAREGHAVRLHLRSCGSRLQSLAGATRRKGQEALG